MNLTSLYAASAANRNEYNRLLVCRSQHTDARERDQITNDLEDLDIAEYKLQCQIDDELEHVNAEALEERDEEVIVCRCRHCGVELINDQHASDDAYWQCEHDRQLAEDYQTYYDLIRS